jgi:hypothetical protein
MSATPNIGVVFNNLCDRASAISEMDYNARGALDIALHAKAQLEKAQLKEAFIKLLTECTLFELETMRMLRSEDLMGLILFVELTPEEVHKLSDVLAEKTRH